MTESDLKELRFLRRERSDLRRRADKSAPEVKAQLDRLSEQINQKILEIEEWIATIDDSYIRQIVRYKYIDGISWSRLPRKMGLYGKGTTEQEAMNRYLTKHGNFGKKP